MLMNRKIERLRTLLAERDELQSQWERYARDLERIEERLRFLQNSISESHTTIASAWVALDRV